MAEKWRVGRHVPHHVYRGDGNTVQDEVAVTHDPADAAQIVKDHEANWWYKDALEVLAGWHDSAEWIGIEKNWKEVARGMSEYARKRLES